MERNQLRYSMLNNLSQFLALEVGLAGEGAAVELVEVVAEYFAGLANGDLRFSGDCEVAREPVWTFEVKFGGRLFSPDDPALGLDMICEGICGGRPAKCPLAGTWLPAAYRET